MPRRASVYARTGHQAPNQTVEFQPGRPVDRLNLISRRSGRFGEAIIILQANRLDAKWAAWRIVIESGAQRMSTRACETGGMIGYPLSRANGTAFPWRVLELVRGQRAIATVWQGHLGPDFETFRDAYLNRWPHAATSVPCPLQCGCSHAVIKHRYGHYVGVCQCDSWNCPDLTLSREEIEVWEFAWNPFLSALRRALGLEGHQGRMRVPNCFEVGHWSGAGIPVILMVEPDFWHAEARVEQLLATTPGKFIVLTPSLDSLGAAARGLIVSHGLCGAGLEQFLAMGRRGVLHTIIPPGELFHAVTPPPSRDFDESVATQTLALVKKLEGDVTNHAPPGLVQVFSLYVLEGLSVRETAARLNCPKTTVGKRTRQLEKLLKAPLAAFRAAGNFDAMLERTRAAEARPRRVSGNTGEIDGDWGD